ncbi:hypothetical protein D7241_04120 [Stutzerimonas sp. VN223-3]|uniref:hypothetical protein n=1 Tax=Stutzerimonas sp. VN223-3 TaxID=3384601 RepID=UPI0038B449F6
MNRLGFPALLLALAVSGVADAEEENMTLQQERDQIGADMEQNRQQIGREINAVREPGISSGSTIEPGAAGSARPNNSVGTRATRPGQAPAGSASNPGITQPGDDDGPITTTGPGSSTVEPGRPTTTGTPIDPSRNGGANGNARPDGGAATGEIGTSGGNGVGGAGTGAAGSGGSAASGAAGN